MTVLKRLYALRALAMPLALHGSLMVLPSTGPLNAAVSDPSQATVPAVSLAAIHVNTSSEFMAETGSDGRHDCLARLNSRCRIIAQASGLEMGKRSAEPIANQAGSHENQIDSSGRLRGYEYFKLRDGLRNSLSRFSAGGSARVVFLGGSITAITGWREMVCEYLQGRFPQTSIDCVNAGMPSTGSTPGAFRLMRDVFSRGPVDLLFEEAAVNDEANGFAAKEQLRGMEGIVRHARMLNPELDIVLLHFVDPGKMETIRRGRTPEVIATHEEVAAHYGIPSIDLAREVTERIDAGEFNWEKDFVGLHPSPFGHGIYFRSIVRLFDAAWKDQDPGSAPKPYPLPAPLDSNSYFRGRLEDIHKVDAGQGWSVVEDWTPEVGDRAETRSGFVRVPMLVADTPGAVCRFRFEGTAAGIFVAAGPDAGIVEFSIDGGPFRRQDLFTRWSSSLHIPWAYMLETGLEPGPHELTLRVSSDSNAGSSGHAVRIVHMLAN